MKYLCYRLSALLLAVLLLLSGGPLPALAAEVGRTDALCELGTAPADMLSGGGRQVRTDEGIYYIGEEDGFIYNTARGTAPVYSHPAAKLNYYDGSLYFARLGEGCFDLCRLDLKSGREEVLLERFSGEPGQLYVVDGRYLDFSCDNAVWQLDLERGSYRIILFAQDLFSFVPTGCGLVYAVGTLFDFDLYVGGSLLVSHVDDYRVDFDLAGGVIIYTLDGVDYQINAAGAFRGDAAAERYVGYGFVPLSGTEAMTEEEAAQAELDEAERIDRELGPYRTEVVDGTEDDAEPVDNDVTPEPPDPAAADPDDPQAPEPVETEPEPEPTEPEPEPTEPEPEPTEPEPEPVEPEPEPTEPEPEPTKPEPEPTEPEPEPTEPEPTEPDEPAEPELPFVIVQPEAPVQEEEDGALRRNLSMGVLNIVKRARQMTSVRWTPRRDVNGWWYSANGVKYTAGVTYTGLPYGQPLTGRYVPWAASLATFVNAVNDPDSLMYTSTGANGAKSGPYYANDCSGFVSWAWDLPGRRTCTSLMPHATKIGNSYTLVQVGDAFISSYHTVLVTDVTYDASGAIASIELSEANVAKSTNFCARSWRYTGAAALLQMENSYLKNKYSIYRSLTRDAATYTHSCAVPLSGDECPQCGAGMFLQPGIDVSEWQGVIDWQEASQELSFAIVRIGWGATGVDDKFEANAQGCEDNDLPYGIYHYAKATTVEQAMAEADHVVGLLMQNGLAPDLPVFYDVEDANMLKLSNADLLAVISAFCQVIEDSGYRAGVYASANVWNTKFTDPAYNNWVRWVAQWQSQNLTANGGASIWQYSCTGQVGGIATAVDLDYWLGPVGDEQHRYKATTVAPTCTEPGSLSYVCVDCGLEVTKQIEALGHIFRDGSCIRCGEPETVFDVYTDLDRDAWYAEAVAFAIENGLFNGVSDTLFAPNATMNRAMTATALYRVAGEPEVEAEALFSDVPVDVWYAKPVTWAAHGGVANGTGGATFSPQADVTREQIAVFLYRYAGLAGLETEARAELEDFPDAESVSGWAEDAMSWAVAVGLIQGTAERDQILLAPQANATRAQVATILQRMCVILEKNGLWPVAPAPTDPDLR